jgi:chemotaxis protein MotB
MQWGVSLGRLGIVLVLGVGVALAAGCDTQQLRERNIALQQGLDRKEKDNANLQAQNELLSEQVQALAGQRDKALADLAAAKGAQPPRKQPTKPEFGGGVETNYVGDSLTVTMPDAILFDSGKADLKPASKQVLDKIAAVLNKDYFGKNIRVEGHTDKQPIAKTSKTWEDNWELSSARALAVVRYLATKGVDPAKLSGDANGEYKPVAKGNTAPSLAKNRRVVIVVNP